MRRLLLAITLIAALIPAGAARAVGYRSKALRGTVHYSVYLPKGYATSGKRYPVVYFLHGLPAGGDAYKSIRWVAQAVRKSGRQAIVVGPQGALRNDPDPEWLDWRAGRRWETWVSSELVSRIDSRYRTIANRRGRVLIGLSAGGYGAALIGNHHPDVFSVFQSWSGYFEPTTPDGSQTLDLGSAKKNRYANLHRLVPSTRHRFGRYYRSTYFSFYVGTRDGRFFSDNQRLAQEMHDYRIPHHFYRVYSGGHNMKLWEAHAPTWLGRALNQAASPRP
jgi:enterochelin esterase-like enzyme